MGNAVFFATRKSAMEGRRRDLQAVLRDLTPLMFVAEAASNRRLQAIETQSSVLRYVCTEHDLPWPEFEKHFREARWLLRRVLDISATDSDVTHRINAASYYLHLVQRSLRYIASPSAAVIVRQACREADSIVQMLQGTLGGRNADDHDATILHTIMLTHPPIQFLGALTPSGLRGHLPDEFRARWAEVAVGIHSLEDARWSRTAATTVRDGIRAYVATTKAIEAASVGPRRDRDLWLEAVQSVIEATTGLAARDGQVARERGVLERCLRGDEVHRSA